MKCNKYSVIVTTLCELGFLLVIAFAVLTDGSRGTEAYNFNDYMPSILDLQVACNARGWDPPLKEDGVYGKNTRDAIEFYNGNDMAKEIFGELK